MTCATEPCDAVEACALSGGCVVTRFPGQQPHEQDTRRKNERALNGTKQRDVRDPVWSPRKRKALVK